MSKIARYLNQLTVGNVFDNPEILEEYSIDRSVLKIKPKLVAFPESTEDIQKLMRFFHQLALKDIKIAVTPRGSGLDEGGADLSNGVIISTKKLNRLLEIDPRERLVRVQSGITLRELNTALSVSGLTIPIDDKDDETIGGLISNNSKGNAAPKYGNIVDFVERIEVILANGECLQTERLKKYSVAKKAIEKTLEGEIYLKISKLLKDNEALIREIGDDRENLAGYPTIFSVPKRETIDLMPLFFGAQGTLGIISEVILRAIPLRTKINRTIATFKEVDSALSYLEKVIRLEPRKLDLYDLRIIMDARKTGKNLDGVIRKLDDGYVVFASFDDKRNNYQKRILAIKEKLPRNAKLIFESLENQAIIDEFENSLTAYLSYVKNGERAPILTDFYLPAYSIKNFLSDVKVLEDKLKLELPLYGSYANSIYNMRPKFNLEEKDFNRRAATFLKAGAYVIDRQGGTIVGGTPEGRLKAVITNDKIPKGEKNLYIKIKEIFDKWGIMNPDVKLGTNSRFTLTHFRDTNLPKIVV